MKIKNKDIEWKCVSSGAAQDYMSNGKPPTKLQEFVYVDGAK